VRFLFLIQYADEEDVKFWCMLASL